MSDRNRFIDLMGDIDPELLREHIEYKKRPSFIRMLPSAVSAAAVILAAVIAIPFFISRPDSSYPPDSSDQVTTAVEPVERLVLYSELSGVPAYDEDYTLPADGEVRIGGELEAALASDVAPDAAYALVLRVGSSEYLNNISNPILAEKANKIMSINEEEIAVFKEKFMAEAAAHLRIITEADFEYRKNIGNGGSVREGINKINEKYDEIIKSHMLGEISNDELNKAMQAKYDELSALTENYLTAHKEFQAQYFSHLEKLDLVYLQYINSLKDGLASAYGEYNSDIYQILDKYFGGDNIYGLWASSREYQQYWAALENRENGIAVEADPESLVRSWLEEYDQTLTKKMRNIIDWKVFSVDTNGMVTKHLSDSGIDYSLLAVKTVSEENIVTNDTDCVIAIMTKEQIETFNAPETVGVELDLAPFDWQDEDSDGIVYSLQRK
ncbi:MAG: hypothetical protein IJF13_03105 [Clostridia bacterium]|nr:hypothetical protein [Clostridia bacterium]